MVNEPHGWRHLPGGADEIPGLLILMPDINDTSPDSDPFTPQDGDLLVGQSTPPSFFLYPVSVPGSGLRNVLGVDNGDTKPTWKALLDTTAPVDVEAPTEAAAAGTSLLAARRDHKHSLTTSETDTSLRLAPDGSGGVEWASGGGGGGGTIHIPMGSATAAPDSTTSGGSDSWTDFGNVRILYNEDEYDFSPLRICLEAMLHTSSVDYQAKARLFDITLGSAVADSEIVTVSTTPDRVRSPYLTLTDGHEYKVQKFTTGSATVFCADARLLIGGSELTEGTDEPVDQLVFEDMPNEIMNWPPLEWPAGDNLQPEWWEETDANATLTAVDLAGEAGITEKYEHAMKLVVATAPSSAYQLFTYADQPRLKAGQTVSVAFDIWSEGSVSCTLSLVSSVPTTNTSAATTAAAWTRRAVEGVVLDGTTIAVRLESGIGTSYWVPLGLVIGSTAPANQLRPRGVRYKHLDTTVQITAFGALTVTSAYADADLTANTSPLAVRAYGNVTMSGNTGTWYYHQRRNGSSEAFSSGSRRAAVELSSTASLMSTSWQVLLDDGQIFEHGVEEAGAGTLATCTANLTGYDEWE